MTAFRKNVFRQIKNSFNRFIAIFGIVALGVGFFAGLKATTPVMKASADRYYDSKGLMDIRVLSTMGLTAEDADAIAAVTGVEASFASRSIDALMDFADGQRAVKMMAYSDKTDINQLSVVEGRLPENDDECVIDNRIWKSGNLELGAQVRVSGENAQRALDMVGGGVYTIVGVVTSPYYHSIDRDSTTIGNGTLSGFVCVPESQFHSDYYTEIYITVSGAEELLCYGDEYKALIETVEDRLTALSEQRIEERYRQIYNDAKAQVDSAQAQLDERRAQADAELEAARAELISGQERLDAAQRQLDEQAAKLADAQKQYEGLTAAGAQAQAAQVKAMIDSGAAQLAAGRAAAEQSRKELADGWTEYTAREQDARRQLDSAQSELDENAAKLDTIERPEWYILDRDANIGVASFEQNSDKIDAIATVFPVFFFLVAALVCLTTMTRMVEEQRTQIGVLKSLGYSKFAIAMKYLIYADTASIAGCVVGLCLGYAVFPSVIIHTYDMLYDSIPAALSFHVPYAVVSSAAAVLCISGATLWACYRGLAEAPAQLVRPKAPAKGKKVFLERIGFLWKRLSFTQKVTARNLIRYKKRFFMTVIGIGGCTALLLTGFGLSDSINGLLPKQFEQLQHTDMTITIKDGSGIDADTELNRLLHGAFSETVYLKQSNVDAESESGRMSVYLVVPEDGEAFTDFVTLRHRTDRQAIDFPCASGAVVSEKFASKLGLSVGDTFTLKSGDERGREVTVGDICENYTYNYVYMSAAQYTDLYGGAPEYTTVWGQLDGGEEALSADILALENVENVTRMSQTKASVADILRGLNGVVVLIVICASALAFIVLYNLTNINITERIREIATIKVLGFRDGEVSAYIYRENIILTIIGTALGLVLGVFLHAYVITTAEVDMVMFVRTISPLSYVYAALFTVAFSAIVNVAAHFSLKRVDMIESLKSVE